MNIFELIQNTDGHELLFFSEPSVSLEMIVAKNSTVLGSAVATCEIDSSNNSETAIKNVVNTAYYNTCKSALFRKSFGGASMYLRCTSEPSDEMFYRAVGVLLNKLNGSVLLSGGAVLANKDLQNISKETDYILGANSKYNKKRTIAEAISAGMIYGLKAIVRKKFDAENLEGLSFVVQGLDGVGENIIKELLKIKNVSLTVTDQVYDKIKIIQDYSPEIKVVKPTEIYKQKCDIFISSLGNNVIDAEAVKQLNCKVLTSSSDEPLADAKIEKLLLDKEILYVPGFIINGGEIIHNDLEYNKLSSKKIDAHLSEIFEVTIGLLNQSEEAKETISATAFRVAKQYIAGVSKINNIK